MRTPEPHICFAELTVLGTPAADRACQSELDGGNGIGAVRGPTRALVGFQIDPFEWTISLPEQGYCIRSFEMSVVVRNPAEEFTGKVRNAVIKVCKESCT